MVFVGNLSVFFGGNRQTVVDILSVLSGCKIFHNIAQYVFHNILPE